MAKVELVKNVNTPFCDIQFKNYEGEEWSSYLSRAEAESLYKALENLLHPERSALDGDEEQLNDELYYLWRRKRGDY